ncbi:MAG TPA: transporter substrate-binding domain-containing protein [Candidatus Binatus sp.]|nr:transporter substrate-binding domain-containing protein [Candidatus Binatus sp.]
MTRHARGWRVAALLVLASACVRAHPALPVLRVGTTGDYPPFSVERGGAFSGLDLEIALRFAAESHYRLEIIRVRWPDLTRALAAGQFDLAIGGVTMRPERALVGTFSRPIARTGAVVLASPAPDGGPPDLDRPGLRIAVNAGGHLERVGARLFPQAVLVRTTDNGALPALLAAGAADAILSDDVEADVFAPRVPDAARVGPLTRDRKAFLGRDPALVARLDAWLRARDADGTLGILRDRWLGAARADARSLVASDLDALLALIDLRLAFMPAVAAAKREAGRPVHDPAQEARVIAAARASALDRGLPPEAAETLLGAVVDASRAVQERFLERPWTVERLDLERAARPALARLSDLIIARAADLARDPEPAALEAEKIAAALDGSLAPAEARLAIARAVVGLRPLERTAPAKVSSTATRSARGRRPRAHRKARKPRHRAGRPASRRSDGPGPGVRSESSYPGDQGRS